MNDRVILQRLETVTPSKILSGVPSKEKPMRAKVIAVGPGRRDSDGYLIRMSVKVGDEVLIGKYAGAIYEEVGDDFKTTEYVIVREDDILTVFAKEEKPPKQLDLPF